LERIHDPNVGDLFIAGYGDHEGELGVIIELLYEEDTDYAPGDIQYSYTYLSAVMAMINGEVSRLSLWELLHYA
jgi:hypothetical protein